MKKTISEYDFINAFKQNSERKDTFSYYGLKALYEYLEQYEDDTGEEMELDVVAICCEYTEYKSATACLHDLLEDLSELDIDWLDASEAEDDNLIEEKAIEYLEEHTSVIVFDGGIIIQDY